MICTDCGNESMEVITVDPLTHDNWLRCRNCGAYIPNEAAVTENEAEALEWPMDRSCDG